MAKVPKISLLLAAILLVYAVLTLSIIGGAAGGLSVGWIPSLSGCCGTVVDCLTGEEFKLGSEVTHHMLTTSNYISFGAVKRDTPSSSCRGASYYNCRPGTEANPYSLICFAITQYRG